jgi:S-adenosylmethionine decarboxylase
MSIKIETLGRHVLIEYYGCNKNILENCKLIEKIMNDAARKSGATIVTNIFHQFSPYGVSGAVIIKESHLSIHTWPEHKYASVDVYTCGDKVDPWKAAHYLEEKLEARKSESIEIPRGMNYKINKKNIYIK